MFKIFIRFAVFLWCTYTGVAYGQLTPTQETPQAPVLRPLAAPPSAVWRQPDRTIDLPEFELITFARYGADGRTLWVVGRKARAPQTTHKNLGDVVLGFDTVAGLVTRDFAPLPPEGTWRISRLAERDGELWVSGQYVEPRRLAQTGENQWAQLAQLPPPATPRFVARWDKYDSAAPAIWFAADPGYAEASRHLDDAASPTWQSTPLHEPRGAEQRYRFVNRDTGQARLELHSTQKFGGPWNMNTASLNDAGRYLFIKASLGSKANREWLFWRYDLDQETWNWPRRLRTRDGGVTLTFSPDGRRAVATGGVDQVANRIDIYDLAEAERYDDELASRMAAVLGPISKMEPATPPVQENRRVTLPGPDTPRGPGPDRLLALYGLGEPMQLAIEPDGQRAYVFHRLRGPDYPAPIENRIRCVALDDGRTLWDVVDPLPFIRVHSNHDRYQIVTDDPRWLILSRTYSTHRSQAWPDSTAIFHSKSDVVLLNKQTGAARHHFSTDVPESVWFTPVVLPEDDPPPAVKNAQDYGNHERLVVVWRYEHDADNAVSRRTRFSWRLERWNLPSFRREVLMDEQLPSEAEGAWLGWKPLAQSFALLPDDPRFGTGVWIVNSRASRGPQYGRDFQQLQVVKFDARTGRKLGSITSPPAAPGRHLRSGPAVGLLSELEANSMDFDLYERRGERHEHLLRVENDRWLDDIGAASQARGRAIYWTHANGYGSALLRLDPRSGRLQGPRAVPKVRAWAFARDGSVAAGIAIREPRQLPGVRLPPFPPVLCLYEFDPAGATPQ